MCYVIKSTIRLQKNPKNLWIYVTQQDHLSKIKVKGYKVTGKFELLPAVFCSRAKNRVLTLLHIAQSVPSRFRNRDQSEDIMCDVPFLARAAQKSNLVPSVPGNTTNPISSENVIIIQRGPEFERRGIERCSVFGAAQGHWVINYEGDLYICVCVCVCVCVCKIPQVVFISLSK